MNWSDENRNNVEHGGSPAGSSGFEAWQKDRPLAGTGAHTGDGSMQMVRLDVARLVLTETGEAMNQGAGKDTIK